MENEAPHILVVEDDASLAAWISDYLSEHGFQVSVANQGDAAIELIATDEPDLVLLDLILPVSNGFEVCKKVRTFFNRPILVMTACTEETDEILSLELGADDYVTKPVKLRVLLARINALLRRSQDAGPPSVLNIGQLQLDSKSKSVTIGGASIATTVNEFEVLWLLASQAGQIVSRDELLTQLRGFEYDGFDRSIDIRISRLRKKLGDDPAQPFKIKTVRGKGYLFASDAW